MMMTLAKRLLEGNKLSLIIQIFIILLIYSLIFYYLCDEDDFYGIDKNHENTFFYFFYYCCLTCSTIGFGDIYPKTVKSRSITLSMIFFVFILSLT
tara:strand:+ start:4905 stop:5192 length:288 start_codon:yes stop_codon:yes gene_type:complete